jgi:hypothetical protein
MTAIVECYAWVVLVPRKLLLKSCQRPVSNLGPKSRVGPHPHVGPLQPARPNTSGESATQSSVRAASYFACGRCIVGSLGSPSLLDTDRLGAPRFQPACGLVSFAFREAEQCRQHSTADSTSRSTYEIAPGNAAIHATAADDGRARRSDYYRSILLTFHVNVMHRRLEGNKGTQHRALHFSSSSNPYRSEI